MYANSILLRIHSHTNVCKDKLCSVYLCNPLSLERGYKDTLHINLFSLINLMGSGFISNFIYKRYYGSYLSDTGRSSAEFLQILSAIRGCVCYHRFILKV